MPTANESSRPSQADVLALLGADPLALAPAALRGLASPAASWGWDDESDDEAGYELVGELAVLTIRGCLMQRGCWWWHGYDFLEAAFSRALLDGRATAVVLALDSPGGVVAGLFDTVKRMRAAADAVGKRVIAVSDERCYSAAYALACVADAIVVPETAGVGSVGVIGTMVSWAAALDAAGVDVRVIVSGAEKADGHPAVPMSDGAVAREQARVDQLAAVFFEWVAARRPLTVAQVTALQAGIRLGPEAVTAKLADRVGTLADLLGGTLTVDECCAHLEADGETEVNEVPVPAPTRDATRAESAPRSIAPMKDLAAILAALGASDAAQGLQIATEATATRTKVLALTGAESSDAALGTIAAWQRDAAAANDLRAQLAADRAAAEKRERAELLDAAVAAMRLTPAEREADGQPEAFVTGMSNGALRAFAARPVTVTPGTPPRQPAKASTTAASLTDEQRAIADSLGLDHAAYAAALAAQG